MVSGSAQQATIGSFGQTLPMTPITYPSMRYGDPTGMPIPMLAELSRLNPHILEPLSLEIVHAIMDESKLPQRPIALIDGVLRKGGKMMMSGAPKTWKSFLAIQLGVCVATGIDWLGIPCEQGDVLYVNLEIDDAQFMKRVFDVATALGADPELAKQHFMVVQRPKGDLTPKRFVDAIVEKTEASLCSLIIIDPLYKLFDGNENEQRDMSQFFSQLDRLIASLGCAVLTVHHQSKGFQGYKDIADRASGSGVLARDPDAIIDVSRIDGPDNAMRMNFVLRDYPERDPIEYTFEHPCCIRDTTGKLAGSRPVNPHGFVSRENKQAEMLAKIEDLCEELIQGRDRFNRKELQEKLGVKKGETINKYLDKSDKFDHVAHGGKCEIFRRE